MEEERAAQWPKRRTWPVAHGREWAAVVKIKRSFSCMFDILIVTHHSDANRSVAAESLVRERLPFARISYPLFFPSLLHLYPRSYLLRHSFLTA